MSMRDSERSVLVGGHVPPKLKEAVTKEAQRCHISVSQLINVVLEAEMKKRGYEL